MIDLDQINQTLSWTGIELIPVSKQPTNRPFVIEVRLNYFGYAEGDKWSKIRNACANAELKQDFILFPLNDTDNKTMALFLPNHWLESWFNQWYQFDRYLGFLLFPQEEETRPVDDPLARTYPVIQKEQRLVDGYRDVYDIFRILRTAEKRIKKDGFVWQEDNARTLVSQLLERKALDRMMVYVIKTMPEYTGSLMESIGEELWQHWKQIEELNERGVM